MGSESVSAMIYGDKVLKCGLCGKEFAFEEGERRFFADKGFGDPKRCRACRAWMKVQRENGKAKAAGAPGK